MLTNRILLAAMSLLYIASLSSGLTPVIDIGPLRVELQTTIESDLAPAAKWTAFKNGFAKSYISVEAEAKAFVAFAGNDMIIREHNLKLNSSYELGHNTFSDMTWDDFRSTYINSFESRPSLLRPTNYTDPHLKVIAPDAIDWEAKGAVTPIKDQGQCGSCWAFSAIGAFEGAYQIATGRLVSFSEQDLVSCDMKDEGCNGGSMDTAFDWIATNGICTENAYPYASGAGKTLECPAIGDRCVAVAGLKSYVAVKQKDEDALQQAAALGPVSVSIEADKSAFQLYKSGIFTSAAKCGKALDHGVLIVGYGVHKGEGFWRVKNSWGTTWGEKGFIRMIRGKNCCGIAKEPFYPTGVSAGAPTPGPAPTPTPTPTPTPGPSPTPTPSRRTHYGNPYHGGCLPDEDKAKILGTPGEICAPYCHKNGTCPTDVPAGATGVPNCQLKSVKGLKECVLTCDPTASDDQCGATCSCKRGGLCTCDKK